MLLDDELAGWAVSVDVDSFDGCNQVERNAIQRARKDHKCDACRETIRRGDRYSYSVFVFDGETSVVKRCARCEVMYRVLQDKMDEYSVVEERLNCGHSWEDNFDGPPPDEVAALAFATPAEAQTLLDMAILEHPPRNEGDA